MAIDIDKFMGRWYIVNSTLPLWDHSKGKTNPRTTATRTGPTTWSDVNEWEEPGKGGQLKTASLGSKDQLDPHDGRAFSWALTGLLFFVRCKCKVVDHDPGFKEYAVVYFGKSLISKPGLDIYRRTNKDFTAERLAEITASARSKDADVDALLSNEAMIATLKSPA